MKDLKYIILNLLNLLPQSCGKDLSDFIKQKQGYIVNLLTVTVVKFVDKKWGHTGYRTTTHLLNYN